MIYSTENLTITSSHPCLIIILVDQSRSMGEIFQNELSKAAFVSNTINNLIYEAGLRCIGSEGNLQNRFEIAIIGYGDSNNVKSKWGGNLDCRWVVKINEIFNNPLEIVDDIPIWIQPHNNGSTPMTKAFNNAYKISKDWILFGKHAECHPPIIINITDGEANDWGDDFKLIYDQIDSIKQLKTIYGPALVFNIHLSNENDSKLHFPSILDTENPLATVLFEISSLMDINMIRIAKQKNYNIKIGARGYIYNGNANDLINFLNIGTPQ